MFFEDLLSFDYHVATIGRHPKTCLSLIGPVPENPSHDIARQ